MVDKDSMVLLLIYRRAMANGVSQPSWPAYNLHRSGFSLLLTVRRTDSSITAPFRTVFRLHPCPATSRG